MSTPIVVTLFPLENVEVEAQSLDDRLVAAKADLFHIVAAVRLCDPTLLARPASADHGVAEAMRRSGLFAPRGSALQASADPRAPASSPGPSSRPRAGTWTTGLGAST